jgi:glyoxylase-like metal-dependent hydrolase (beta-lactamase superfamily II)
VSDPVTRHLGHGIATIPIPLPFPRLRWVNSYILEADDGLVVIDVGVDDDLSWQAFTGGLVLLGYRPEDVDVLVGSHLHVDHVGMASRVVDALGPDFVMHRSALERLPGYDDFDGFFRRMEVMARRHGVTPDELAEVTHPEPRPAWWPAGAEPNHPVDDGDTIRLSGDRRLAVVHTPGHDASHIVLADSKTGVVFSGDHVLPRITPVVLNDDDGGDSLGAFMDSLTRCQTLMSGLTLPAHGAPIERGGERARQLRLHHQRRLRDVEDALHVPATAWAVTKNVFAPHLVGIDARLALRETLAHLIHLELTGRVRRFEQGGVTWFRLP